MLRRSCMQPAVLASRAVSSAKALLLTFSPALHVVPTPDSLNRRRRTFTKMSKISRLKISSCRQPLVTLTRAVSPKAVET
eukprot:2012641-Rhodomonas_salina.1